MGAAPPRGFWKPSEEGKWKLILVPEGGAARSPGCGYCHVPINRPSDNRPLGCVFPLRFKMKLVFFSCKMCSPHTHPKPRSRACRLCLERILGQPQEPVLGTLPPGGSPRQDHSGFY